MVSGHYIQVIPVIGKSIGWKTRTGTYFHIGSGHIKFAWLAQLNHSQNTVRKMMNDQADERFYIIIDKLTRHLWPIITSPEMIGKVIGCHSYVYLFQINYPAYSREHQSHTAWKVVRDADKMFYPQQKVILHPSPSGKLFLVPLFRMKSRRISHSKFWYSHSALHGRHFILQYCT